MPGRWHGRHAGGSPWRQPRRRTAIPTPAPHARAPRSSRRRSRDNARRTGAPGSRPAGPVAARCDRRPARGVVLSRGTRPGTTGRSRVSPQPRDPGPDAGSGRRHDAPCAAGAGRGPACPPLARARAARRTRLASSEGGPRRPAAPPGLRGVRSRRQLDEQREDRRVIFGVAQAGEVGWLDHPGVGIDLAVTVSSDNWAGARGGAARLTLNPAVED